MRDINLYPRKPFLERYRNMTLLAIIALGLLLVLIQFLIDAGFEDERASAESGWARTESLTEAIQRKKTLDSRTVIYNHLKNQAEQLKANRSDWLTDMTYVLGYLPQGAAVTRMNVSDDAKLDAELRFVTAEDALGYLMRLQSEPRYRELMVMEFKKVEEEQTVEDSTPVSDENVASQADDANADVPALADETSPSPDVVAEESLTESEIAVRELLLSNPDDLSEKLRALLEARGGHSEPESTQVVEPTEPPASAEAPKQDVVQVEETPYRVRLMIPLNAKAVKP